MICSIQQQQQQDRSLLQVRYKVVQKPNFLSKIHGSSSISGGMGRLLLAAPAGTVQQFALRARYAILVSCSRAQLSGVAAQLLDREDICCVECCGPSRNLVGLCCH